MADILVFCMRQETGDKDSSEASPWNWVVMNVLLPSQLQYTESWNNGKEVPRWGVAEIQKMSPSTTGRCSRHAAAVLSNKGVGTADQWERGTATQQPITWTYYICCPVVVGRSVFAVQAWLNL